MSAARHMSLHQRGCSVTRCGGTFVCCGCERLVGWCFGCGDLLGEEHCDDCWHDRLSVLQRVKSGYRTKKALSGRSPKVSPWQRQPLVVAEELREDGFLEFKRNGQFVLTKRAREALET